MRFRNTHNQMTRWSMPHTKRKLIDLINSEIDNPTPMYQSFRKIMWRKNKLNRINGINYVPHREQGGHNWEDGVYFMIKYGHEGYLTWLNHMAQDRLSDMLLQRYGSFTRNIVEDSIQEFSRPKYRKNRPKYR